MSYKYSKGRQVIGDLKAADDTQRDTLIDFGEDYIGLETSGSVRMVISGSDGKVGIGVANPSYKLDVNGDIRIRGNDIRDNSGNKAISFDGSANTTFAGRATDLSGSQIVGGVYQLDDGLIQNPNSSYSRIFFPADDNMNETVGAVSTNYKIAPFDGSAIKMQVKTTTDFTGKTLTGSLHVGVGTANAYSATPSLSVGVAGAAANTVYTFNFEGLNGSGLNEGNIFGFSLQLSENYAGNETIHFTTAVRFNPYA